MKTVKIDAADKAAGITIRGEVRIEGADDELADAIAEEYREAGRRAFARLERQRR